MAALFVEGNQRRNRFRSTVMFRRIDGKMWFVLSIYSLLANYRYTVKKWFYERFLFFIPLLQLSTISGYICFGDFFLSNGLILVWEWVVNISYPYKYGKASFLRSASIVPVEDPKWSPNEKWYAMKRSLGRIVQWANSTQCINGWAICGNVFKRPYRSRNTLFRNNAIRKQLHTNLLLHSLLMWLTCLWEIFWFKTIAIILISKLDLDKPNKIY